MKTLSILLLFILVSLAGIKFAFGQSISADSAISVKPYRNSVYLEAGGNGGMGSVNYERLFPNPGKGTAIAVRIGGAFIPAGRNARNLNYTALVPLEVTYITGQKAVKLETGGGVSWLAYSYTNEFNSGPRTSLYAYPVPFFRIGGRWIPAEKPWFVRFGLTPFLFSYREFPFILPWAGVSFGYSFGQ